MAGEGAGGPVTCNLQVGKSRTPSHQVQDSSTERQELTPGEPGCDLVSRGQWATSRLVRLPALLASSSRLRSDRRRLPESQILLSCLAVFLLARLVTTDRRTVSVSREGWWRARDRQREGCQHTRCSNLHRQ